MKTILLGCILTVSISFNTMAQSLISNTGTISFQAADKKDVHAESVSFTSKIDLTEKIIVFSVPVQSFTFKSAVMQKHFNQEKVMNSAVYPKAKFKGSIISDADLSQDGTHAVKVKGKMTIKGVTQDFEADGTITIANGAVSSTSSFTVNGHDFGIDSGKVKGFSDNIQVTLSATYN